MAVVDTTELIETARNISLSLIFFFAILYLIRWQRMKYEKTMITSALRGLVQLFLLSGILAFLFAIENGWIIFGIIGIMTGFSSQTVARRLRAIPNSNRIQITAQFTAVYITMILVVMIGILPFEAAFIVPIGGMVAGNSMNMSYLIMDRLLNEIKNRKGEIESALALGGSPRVVMRHLNITRNALINGITPITNRLRTLGIVTIPGLMAGMIIGGINPIIAAFYQILIFFLIIFAGMIAGIISVYMSMDQIFDGKYYRLQISLTTK